ncbi:MAG TPA: hypothetical protein VN577_10730 [Terriglobales bacterium]|nr:hypothetical protein [Terriglobales bacterium]
MRRFLLAIALMMLSASLFAQDAPPDNTHGVMVRVAQIYVSPDAGSAKLGEVTRGREVVVRGQSKGWLQVTAYFPPQKEIAGWIVDKGVIRPNTPDGDRIAFGEATASELIASQRGGRKGAADDARRLYYRVYEFFPKSKLAGEALYRAADIQWQIEAGDLRARPRRDPNLRDDIDDTWMKLVMKKFPGTKWADLAAYHLLDNKTCGNWDDTKCPEKEAELYEKYAVEHPGSPSAPEALYNSAYRRAVLNDMYKSENKQKQADESKNRAKATAQNAIAKYPDTDWAYRAQALIYMLEQSIPIYGNAVE